MLQSFNSSYLLAMREQAPRMFNRLNRTGALMAHVSAKAKEANVLFEELAAKMPKLPNGVLESPSDRQQVTELVYATMIEFPPDDPESQD